MIVRASGNNATIDLFEHHLVITRRQRGVFLDGQDAEHMIPLSSITSVQFVRPGFLTAGKIVLVLAAGTSPRSGTLADPNTVFFAKAQLTLFENVLGAIQAAIATPSIERLAMEAQRRQSIGNTTPRPIDNKSIEVVSQPHTHGGSYQGPYGETGTYRRDGYATDGESQSAHPSSGAGGWWRDMPLMGKIILIGGAAILLLNMCSSGTSTPGEDPSAATAETSSPEVASEPSAETMLGDWSEFVTGKPRTSQFALTDGSGSSGEFCNATDGENIMTFGSPDTGDGLKIYDMFSKRSTRSDTGFMGAFWFDRASGEIRALRLIQKKYADRPPDKANDFTMKVLQVAPGAVVIDGVTYHSCVI